MKNLVINSLFISGILLSTSSLELKAQGRSGIAPGKNKPGNTTGVPIDGGAGLLLAAGAAYGLKKLKDYRNRNHDKF